MAYYDNDTVYQTQTQALNDCYTVNSLKALAKLICDDIPTRKADLIAAITGAMAGEKIKGVFDRLDRIGQHIVAEAVFAPDGKVDYRKIEAKYQSSSGAGRHSEYLSESDLLSLFIINRQVPADMRGRLKTFVPMPKSDHVKYVNKLPKSIKSDIEGDPRLPLEIRRTARAALHNLEVVLRLIDGGKLKVSPATGRPTSATEKNIAKRLHYPWKLYLGDPHYGHLDDYGSEPIIGSRYLLAFLFEYAATLGLIDVAFTHPAGARMDFDHFYGGHDLEYLSRYDGLKYFRLNPLGEYGLGLSDGYDPPVFEPRPVLTVLPNHEIVITDAAALSPADKLFLDKIGKKASSALWRLTLPTLLAAAQSGTDSKQVRAFLESRSSHPLPETVIQLLKDTAGRSTRLTYSGRAHLIACKDPILVQLISSDRKASKLCLAAADDYIVVLPGKEKDFIKTLADMGYIVPQFGTQI